MKLTKLFSAFLFLAILSVAAKKILNSSVFEWEKLPIKTTATGEVRNIFSSPTQTLNLFDIKAVTLNPGNSTSDYTVKNGFDELIIIKEGSAEISINSESKKLGEGSLVVASQGDKVKIRNLQNTKTTFYLFLFNPKTSSVPIQTAFNVIPVLKDWNSLELKPSAVGGRRDIMKQPTSALKELEMHTTTLNEGLQSHIAHTHPDEEIILVRFGFVEETINGTPFKLGPGSVIFLSNNDNHSIRNAGTGKCEYYAIRWLTYQTDKKK
jgi:quercetin dioxygenase-like cupin family protein